MADSAIIIPAITLWQPWACLVERGAKVFETRSKPPPKRLIGKRIAIHAAARPCFTNFDQETADEITEAFGRCGWNFFLPRGVVTCTVLLTEALPAESVEPDAFGDYSSGRWAWRLTDVIPINPHVPAMGMQTWGWPWRVPDDVKID